MLSHLVRLSYVDWENCFQFSPLPPTQHADRHIYSPLIFFLPLPHFPPIAFPSSSLSFSVSAALSSSFLQLLLFPHSFWPKTFIMFSSAAHQMQRRNPYLRFYFICSRRDGMFAALTRTWLCQHARSKTIQKGT